MSTPIYDELIGIDFGFGYQQQHLFRYASDVEVIVPDPFRVIDHESGRPRTRSKFYRSGTRRTKRVARRGY